MPLAFEGWETVLPSLPEKCTRYAATQGGLSHGELKSPVCSFSSSLLTADLVARVLEVYVIAKRSHEYSEMLKVRRTKQKGGSMDKLKEKDQGSLSFTLVWMDCSHPGMGGPTCLRCPCTDAMGMSALLGVIEVDGLLGN